MTASAGSRRERGLVPGGGRGRLGPPLAEGHEPPVQRREQAEQDHQRAGDLQQPLDGDRLRPDRAGLCRPNPLTPFRGAGALGSDQSVSDAGVHRFPAL